MKKLFVLLIFLVLFFGCIAPPTQPVENAFKLGETFSIKDGQTFSEKKENLIVTAVSFSDSRCDKNVKCVWEGEKGINLILIVDKSKSQEIYLGTITNPKEIFSSYEIELISIDFESKTAELKITNSK